MKILVVDDDASFGTLLRRALRRLGHATEVALHAEDALAMMATDEFDAVITDLEMPVMNGVELARAIHAAAPAMPIAFCTRAGRDAPMVADAAALGHLLPKVWTVADVKSLIGVLEKRMSRVARGTQSEMSTAAVPRLIASEHPTIPLDARSNRRVTRKIKVSCRHWDQVTRLCDAHAMGRNVLTLRGSHRLQPRERLVVALHLPDELVLSIEAHVVAMRSDAAGSAFAIRLTGLTPRVIGRLRAMVQRAASEASARESLAHPAVLGNSTLRHQIETLTAKMRRSSEHGEEH